MEENSVCKLKADDRFEGILMVRGAEKKMDRKGHDYVDLSLGDRTGEMNAKIWYWNARQEVPETGAPLWIKGQVQEFNGRLQMRIEEWHPPKEGEKVDLSGLVPSAPRTSEDMMREIRETVNGFSGSPRPSGCTTRSAEGCFITRRTCSAWPGRRRRSIPG